MQEIGWNYRIPDILCALGVSQLRACRFHDVARRLPPAMICCWRRLPVLPSAA